jgi:hypothetical protein
MNNSKTLVAEPIAELQRQLDQFRSTQPARSRLPEPVWSRAVELVRRHGVYTVAHALRLDYMGLKRRLGEKLQPRRMSKPAFVEVMAQPSTVPDWVIEWESSSGVKMRIQGKACAPPDWASLLRTWLETTE